MKLSFLFSLIYVSSLFAQTAAIKKNLDEMFFKVPLNAAKFEVRTMLHSSEKFFNISDFDEINKAISSDFKENYKFTYLTNCCRIVFGLRMIIQMEEKYLLTIQKMNYQNVLSNTRS